MLRGILDIINKKKDKLTPNESKRLEEEEAWVSPAKEPWHSGLRTLRMAQEAGAWDDGEPIGRGFSQPYISEKSALAIAAGRQTVEVNPDPYHLPLISRSLFVRV